uniref:Uncharacterized protein n=1 Tax=Rhodosorus marinus TaxID=101924 RepID=A0A7S0BP99_9RHOD|mmetsp:Transcript_25319/g.36457  ORF Transcript_25319/g.36457 Transcript_25319/m.36457 type:complete len:110 (+) Transcript_25319:222-551(+)
MSAEYYYPSQCCAGKHRSISGSDENGFSEERILLDFKLFVNSPGRTTMACYGKMLLDERNRAGERGQGRGAIRRWQELAPAAIGFAIASNRHHILARSPVRVRATKIFL